MTNWLDDYKKREEQAKKQTNHILKNLENTLKDFEKQGDIKVIKNNIKDTVKQLSSDSIPQKE